jgi:hypothetical protein
MSTKNKHMNMNWKMRRNMNGHMNKNTNYQLSITNFSKKKQLNQLPSIPTNTHTHIKEEEEEEEEGGRNKRSKASKSVPRASEKLGRPVSNRFHCFLQTMVPVIFF